MEREASVVFEELKCVEIELEFELVFVDEPECAEVADEEACVVVTAELERASLAAEKDASEVLDDVV